MTRFYLSVRKITEALCEPLCTEDYVVQSMPDVSPPKWHLAHTSWFFEKVILEPRGYAPQHPHYDFLFNSYYESIGPRVARCQRGLQSRPTVKEIYAYRHATDDRMTELLSGKAGQEPELRRLLEIGLNHEQQHQELLLTDIKHILWTSPLRPSYLPKLSQSPPSKSKVSRHAPLWMEFSGGLEEIGFSGDGFAFDNETPRHRIYLEPFKISHTLVTNGEWLAFMDDGGYSRPEFWLSDGWRIRTQANWTAPLYQKEETPFWCPLDLDAPVCHVSFYEAYAYAQWKKCRLPTEAEWEIAASRTPTSGHFADRGIFYPLPPSHPDLPQFYGDVWEWTQSPYQPYPGYRPWKGQIAEYNAKFMCNQMTLRGGSCVTPAGHIRPTYRNFFSPESRWQFTGVRLAACREVPYS